MTPCIDTRRVAFIAILCGLLIFSVACSNDHSSTTQQKTLFSTVMFAGDSLTAGYQSGSLWQKTQVNGWAPLVAKQGGFQIIQPLIADPGIPAALELVSLGPPPDIQPMPGTSTGRINQLMWPTDVAVPGHKVNDLINYAPVVPPVTGEDIITDVVLAYPPGQTGTQLQQVIAADPTAVFVWIGNNDALIADFAGTPAVMTSASDFNTQFTSLMNSLSSKTSAKLLVANIPDVTSVPYLFPAPVILAQVQQVLAAHGVPIDIPTLSVMMGIGPGDYVNLEQGVQVEVPAFLASFPTGAPLSDSAVLSAAEVAQVQANVDAYNAIIAAQVASAGGTLVDTHALFTAIGDCRIPGFPCASGVTINGYQATNAFLGGLFSLDGVHPTNTGYALIANAFIDTMNASLGTTVADVDVAAVAAADPLFPPNFPTGATTQLGTLKTGQLPKGIPKSAWSIFHR
jgi:GDSL-like Lipase/Acylhydrolase